MQKDKNKIIEQVNQVSKDTLMGTLDMEFIDFGEGFFTHENKDKLFLNHFKKSFGGIKYPLFRGDKVLSSKWDYFFQLLREIKNLKIK